MQNNSSLSSLRKHFAATGYVFNSNFDSVFFVFHKKLQKWLPPGGHLLEGELPHECVLREVFEETGLRVRIINLFDPPVIKSDTAKQLPLPFCILQEKIPSFLDEEEHFHINFIFSLEVNETNQVILSTSEVSAGKWIHIEEIETIDTFDSVISLCKVMESMKKAAH